MFDFVRRKVSTLYAIERQFNEATLVRWNNNLAVVFHFLARGEEMFCCVGDVWWELKYHWSMHEDEQDWGNYIQIDSIEKIEPPQDVVYSHTTTGWWNAKEDGPFLADRKECVEGTIWSEASQYDLGLSRYL